VQTVNVPEKSNPESLYRIRNLLPQWKWGHILLSAHVIHVNLFNRPWFDSCNRLLFDYNFTCVTCKESVSILILDCTVDFLQKLWFPL
jgi:hypothetical protein